MKPRTQLSIQQFETLINKSESDVLDFKKAMYDFDDDRENKKIAKYVKDIISFCNTVRAETSYIIVGIEEKEDGKKELIGLDKNIDDSILQAKVKDKVIPLPKFYYYTISYNNLQFGVFEFPITKYIAPIAPTVALKGLVVGMPYYRNSTSNVEAIGTVHGHIIKWMDSLPSIRDENKYSENLTNLISKASNNNFLLSATISETLGFAKAHNKNSLAKFCTNELMGFQNVTDENEIQNEFMYRGQTTVFTLGKIEGFSNTTPEKIKQYLKANDVYYEYKIIYNYPISEIESKINITKTSQGIFRLERKAKEMFPNLRGKNSDVTFLMFHETFVSVYDSIRRKLLEKLIAE